MGLLREKVVHCSPKRLGDIRFALIRAPRRLPIELAEAEMQVSEVRELQCSQ
jgi:hypothetical protein